MNLVSPRCLLMWALTLVAASTRMMAADSPSSAQPEVYFMPFSHLDFYWGGTREECLARGNHIIAKAIYLANRSPKFRFLLEDEVFVANFVETHLGTTELADLKRCVREGRIEIAPKWAAIFQDLPDGEVQARNLILGKRYARATFGVDPQVAHLGDLPGYTPQFPQLLRQAAVPFLVMTRMGPADKSLFYWRAPDGSTALVWNTLKGYGWGTFLSSKTQLDELKRARFRQDVAEVRATTPGPILMNWGTDLWAPPDDLVKIVEKFNAEAPARLVLATASDFFSHARTNEAIPELSGEIPSSWPNVVSSLPHLWPQVIPATSTLLAAETFATINYALGFARYPQREFDFLWKKLIESMDHNHDGQGGALGDNRKLGYMQLALLQGGEILRDSLRNIAERVQVPFTNSFPIVVFNPLSWTRDDVVRAHVTLFGEVSPADLGPFKRGMRLLDQQGASLPFHLEGYSENISRALELVFVARQVPSLGYRTYYLVPADQPDTFPMAANVERDDDRDRQEPRRPLSTNVVENEFYRVSVDRATGRATLFDKELGLEVCRNLEIVAAEERGGNYIGIEPPTGRTIFSVVDRVLVEETNAIRAVIRIDSRIADIALTQRLMLYRGLKRLELENAVEWTTPRFVRLDQVFPLTQTNVAIHYGVPFGANASDQLLPNTGPHAPDEIRYDSWRASRLIQHWIHAGTADWGLTLATDHQQVRLGPEGIHAPMLRGTRFVSVKVVRGDTVTSLHYPPPGHYVFRYALSSGRGDWKAARAYRAGLALNHPLLPVSVADDLSSKSMPPAQSFCSIASANLLVSAVKKSDSDPSILLRVYEIEGVSAEAQVNFLGHASAFTEVSLLEERQESGVRERLRLGPNAIKTIQLEVRPRNAE